MSCAACITPEQYQAVALEDGAAPTSNYHAELLAAINAAKATGMVLEGNGKTYRATQALIVALQTADHLDWRNINFLIEPATGNDLYLIYLDGGDFGPTIPVTSDVAAQAASVQVSGTTKPVAGQRYWLIDDQAGTHQTAPVCTKAQTVVVAPDYDGVSATVPLTSETVTSFAVASSARLRAAGVDARVRLDAVAITGPGDGAVKTTGLVTRNLNQPYLRLSKISDCTNRGYLDFASYAPDVEIQSVENITETGLGYAVALGGTQHGRVNIQQASNVGVAYTASISTVSNEQLPARMNDFGFCTVQGATRSVLDTHPGAFDTFFGGCSVVTAPEQSGSDDMVVCSGSRMTVYGPMVQRGGGHRHLVTVQLTGSTDAGVEADYVRLQSVSGTYNNSALLVLTPSGLANSFPVDVTYQVLSGSGSSGVWVQPTSADLTVTGVSTRIAATSSPALRVLAQAPGTGRGFIHPGDVDCSTGASAVAEVSAAAFGSGSSGDGGVITLPSGQLSRTGSGATLNAVNGAILHGPDPVLTRSDATATASAGGYVREAVPQALSSAASPSFDALSLGGNTSQLALGVSASQARAAQFHGPTNDGVEVQFIRGTQFAWQVGMTSNSDFYISDNGGAEVLKMHNSAGAGALELTPAGDVKTAGSVEAKTSFILDGNAVITGVGAAIDDVPSVDSQGNPDANAAAINAILAHMRAGKSAKIATS